MPDPAPPRSDMFRRLSERFGPPVALTSRPPGEPPPRRLRLMTPPATPAASSLPGLHDLFRQP